MYRIFGFYLLLLLMACGSTKEDKAKVYFSVQNLAIDSVGFRLLHYMDGKELFDTLVSTKDQLILPALHEDMYLAVLYWPRTYIPHALIKNKLFNLEEGDDYTLTKAFYLAPKEKLNYTFYLDSPYPIADIEIQHIKAIKVDTVGCESCRVAELFWDRYNAFFSRKDTLIRTEDLNFYAAVENKHPDALARFKTIDSIRKTVWIDSVFNRQFAGLVNAYATNKATSFFVFYQLYTERDFPKYKTLFHSLSGDAKNAKYYVFSDKEYRKQAKR
ncbi:hypothetical protein ACL9RF_07975 [Sphingobacterium sp. Mn56C]|uniref:hypothetical protein n=1 Tax=Sphingobacterium sp. Mn56C TaxID=3395261 RepID=UPI003BEC048D